MRVMTPLSIALHDLVEARNSMVSAVREGGDAVMLSRQLSEAGDAMTVAGHMVTDTVVGPQLLRDAGNVKFRAGALSTFSGAVSGAQLPTLDGAISRSSIVIDKLASRARSTNAAAPGALDQIEREQGAFWMQRAWR